MKRFLGRRAIASAISLVGLVVLVFFLSRLTGDPTSLYLPVDASPSMVVVADIDGGSSAS